MNFEIFLRRADIDPVLVEHERHNRLFMLQQRGKQTALEGIRLAFRHVFQHGRFKDIDAGVDRIAGDFVGSGFFDESLNPALRVRFDQTIGRRIFDRGQDDGGNGPFARW